MTGRRWLLVLGLCWPTAAVADLDAGEAAYARGNYATALKEFRHAAEQGYAGAQYNLGVMYYFGEGVSVNSIKAYMWWSLAMEQGNESATKNLNIIKEEMNSAEISIAQELASEMWEQINN